ITDHARFAEISVAVEADDDPAAILRRIEAGLEDIAGGMQGRPLALRIRLTGKSRYRYELLARAQDFRDEAQAACHRCHEDIWLEKLDTRLEAETADGNRDAEPGLGLDSLIPLRELPPDLIVEAADRIAEIAARLPGGTGAGELPLGDDAATLLDEARELLLGRAAEGRGGR